MDRWDRFVRSVGLCMDDPIPQKRKDEPPIHDHVEVGLFLAFFLIAVFLRFWRLDAVPNGVFLDPGRMGWNALTEDPA